MDHRVTHEPTHPDEPSGYWEWVACGASATGSQHIARGLGCDDAYGYAISDELLVAVVADGAGSVSGTSAWGAHAACQGVLTAAMSSPFIKDFGDATADEADAIMRWLFDHALNWVRECAENMALALPQLATTLCVAVARPGFAVFGQIGDGIIAAESGGVIDTYLIEDKAEYANATWFIQSPGAFEESFRTAVCTDLTALALSTDGMSYKITNIATGEPYEPFFRGAWQNVESGGSAADFAAMLRGIADDQTGDDKTMVLAVLRQVPDQFHPSARPNRLTRVGSPAPAAPPVARPAAERTPVQEPQRIVTNGEITMPSAASAADEVTDVLSPARVATAAPDPDLLTDLPTAPTPRRSRSAPKAKRQPRSDDGKRHWGFRHKQS